MKNFNEKNFMADLEKVNWNIIDEFSPEDVDNKAKVLELLLSQVIDDNAPFETIIIHEKTKPLWMNDKIEKMMDERDNLLDKYNKTRNHRLKNEWRSKRNLVSQEIRKSKKKKRI